MVDDKDDIPNIEQIANAFDNYEYMMLPHGGQSHRTFDKAMHKGVKFDTALTRSIYYNQFDGFTSRSNQGVEETVAYFKRLGINEFVNLVTCTDNYTPEKYPETKVVTSEKYVPTWIYAKPNFNGLRLSLSENSRLFYGDSVDSNWGVYIKSVKLENDMADINIKLTPGLNVVIGGSSSGKTMLVDMIYRNISGYYDENIYSAFGMEKAEIINETGVIPHYINQNFIINILQNKEKDINEIDIISNIFPEDETVANSIQSKLEEFRGLIVKLVSYAEKIETLKTDINKIPKLSSLIISGEVHKNIFACVLPDEDQMGALKFDFDKRDKYIALLDELSRDLKRNPLANNYEDEIKGIKYEVERIHRISLISDKVYNIIKMYKDNESEKLMSGNKENQTKQEEKERLFNNIKNYINDLRAYDDILEKIATYDICCATEKVEVNGHKLSIENKFKLSAEILVETVNQYLKKDFRVNSIEGLRPEVIVKSHFSDKPKVTDYSDFSQKVYTRISSNNKKKYHIITNQGKDFDSLSPGWKSAVLLDLILGYKKDLAPIIIDQPEDNLATDYINHNLVKLIKEIKLRKQVILVSHNATIPMLGDAQNVIVCKNENGVIKIRSALLEEEIDGIPTLDYIANLTDGGKPAIKKRVKKYNLKNYVEGNNENRI